MGNSARKEPTPPPTRSTSPVHQPNVSFNKSTTTVTTPAAPSNRSNVVPSSPTIQPSSSVSSSTGSHVSRGQQAAPASSTVHSSNTVSKPKISTPAHQKTIYPANNYVFPKCLPQCPQPVVDRGVIADKYSLRVCPQYNSRNGCKAVLCRRLHVCLMWAQNKCSRPDCYYDHAFYSENHNIELLAVFDIRRDLSEANIKEMIQENHSFKRKPKPKFECICMHNIMRKCQHENCRGIHTKSQYLWQLCQAGQWIFFAHNQSDYLESMYTYPTRDKLELPPVPSHIANQKKCKNLINALFPNLLWHIDFEAMVITSSTNTLKIRRLSTPSDITTDNRLASRWIWYWEDDDGRWHPYLEGCRQFFIVALSDQLEYHYHFFGQGVFKVQINNVSYNIDIRRMVQRNLTSGRERRVQRRPSAVRSKDQPAFDSSPHTWPDHKKFVKLPVLPITAEFMYLEKLMKDSLHDVKIVSINKVQNSHLWKVYKNKREHLLALYNNDQTMLNEQYLFHGTKHSVIDQICAENLDWRLFGSNVGHLHGQGIYFANKASLSDSYSETGDMGIKAMFIAYVLVGAMTVGERNMELPPDNPQTKRRYDTTCNNSHDASIFVKYNRDEYYPAYIVLYRRGWSS